jgi:hypothetical protein
VRGECCATGVRSDGDDGSGEEVVQRRTPGGEKEGREVGGIDRTFTLKAHHNLKQQAQSVASARVPVATALW